VAQRRLAHPVSAARPCARSLLTLDQQGPILHSITLMIHRNQAFLFFSRPLFPGSSTRPLRFSNFCLTPIVSFFLNAAPPLSQLTPSRVFAPTPLINSMALALYPHSEEYLFPAPTPLSFRLPVRRAFPPLPPSIRSLPPPTYLPGVYFSLLKGTLLLSISPHKGWP